MIINSFGKFNASEIFIMNYLIYTYCFLKFVILGPTESLQALKADGKPTITHTEGNLIFGFSSAKIIKNMKSPMEK